MRQRRAVAVLEIRAVDTAERIFEGIANSDSVDTFGTIIEPRGAEFKLPLPLFFHDKGMHDHGAPIGNVIATEIRGGKRWVRAQVPQIADDGTEGTRDVKRRVDGAWTDIKSGLVRGLSIDFIPLEPKIPLARDRVKRWNWLGLTVVPMPANVDATIVTVRSAFGGDQSPGASGTPSKPGVRAMNIREQIKQLERQRAAKVADRDELHERAAAEGRTLNEEETQQFDALDAEINAIDSTTQRLEITARDAEARAEARAAQANAQRELLDRAVPVAGTTSQVASRSRGGAMPVVQVRDTADKGIGFARYCMALAHCKGNRYEAEMYAQRTWGDGASEVRAALRDGLLTRAPIAPGTTTNATFAAPLVPTTFLNDFLELLRPATLVGRIQGLRQVPFNVSLPVQTAGGTYKWVGQGKAKGVTNAQYNAATLSFAKASGIIVLTEELVRLSSPAAEGVVRDEMVAGCTQFLDAQFVDSTVAAVAGVNPASITNGVAGVAASAATAAAFRTDVAARIASLVALGYPVSQLAILLSESIAFNMSLALNAVGTPLFPGLTAQGGTIVGVQAVASQSVGNQVVVAHTPSIMIADEGGVEIDVSREASVQLDSAPTDPPDQTAVLTSLWQFNLVGLRVDRLITWGKARSTAVDRITGAAYVP